MNHDTYSSVYNTLDDAFKELETKVWLPESQSSNIFSFFLFCINSANSTSSSVPYNLLLEYDSYEEGMLLANSLASIGCKLLNTKDHFTVLTEEEFNKHILNHDFDDSAPRIVIIKQMLLQDDETWEETFDAVKKTGNIIKIYLKSTEENVSRIENDSFFRWRYLNNHISKPNMSPKDAIHYFHKLAYEKTEILSFSDAFCEELEKYVLTVYPKAKLSEEDFVFDLIDAINQKKLSYPNVAPGNDILDKIKRIREFEFNKNIELEDENELNIMILSLSTFPRNMNNITQYSYNDGDKNYIIDGIYQLDPVPNLLKEQNIPLDYVLMLSTEKTEQTVSIETPDYKKDEAIAAREYFMAHMIDKMRKPDEALQRMQYYIVDEAAPASAIHDSVAFLQKIQAKSNINLIVDMHGGLRGIQAVLSAILSLINDSNDETPYSNTIHQTVFTVEFGNNTGINRIVLDESTRIFNFVSGINEFTNYGRINSLYKFISPDENKALLSPIEEIAEGIQWCDINKFEEGLRDLSKYYKNESIISDSYLKLFEERIKYDYGELLNLTGNQGPDPIACVKWCMRKGFFQQALTIIESKMYLVWKNIGIWTITDDGQNMIKKERINEYSFFNYCINSNQFSPLSHTSWKDISAQPNYNKKHFNQIFEEPQKVLEIYKTINQRADLSKNCKNNNNNTANNNKGDKTAVDIISGNISIEIETGSGKNKQKSTCNNACNFSIKSTNEKDTKEQVLVSLIFIHKALKDARNTSNHVKKNLYQQNALKNAIQYYLDALDYLSK